MDGMKLYYIINFISIKLNEVKFNDSVEFSWIYICNSLVWEKNRSTKVGIGIIGYVWTLYFI